MIISFFHYHIMKNNYSDPGTVLGMLGALNPHSNSVS